MNTLTPLGFRFYFFFPGSYFSFQILVYDDGSVTVYMVPNGGVWVQVLKFESLGLREWDMKRSDVHDGWLTLEVQFQSLLCRPGVEPSLHLILSREAAERRLPKAMHNTTTCKDRASRYVWSLTS